MAALHQQFPVEVFCFASPVYWPDTAALQQAYQHIQQTIRETAGSDVASLQFSLLHTEDAARHAAEKHTKFAIFVAMSGGVQPWMQRIANATDHIALAHAYLPGFLCEQTGRDLLNRNAHPASTDIYAWGRRTGKSILWLHNRQELTPVMRGYQGAQRLAHATILKIGETEPWVINSCRDPERFRSAFGTQIIPISLDELYARVNKISAGDVADRAEGWVNHATALVEANAAAVHSACRVAAAFESLVKEYDADGLSIACFSLIGALDTTSCLAVSELNDTPRRFAACEGDLDAAATMLLLKAIGADFVWVANPIIHDGDFIDLVHCTAPRCACQQKLSYRLLHHHESGRGVSPEVVLPDHQRVTLSRIGLNLTALSISCGESERIAKIPACHTQLRVHLDDAESFLDRLLGTHVVLSYGEHADVLTYAARFLNLQVLASKSGTLRDTAQR